MYSVRKSLWISSDKHYAEVYIRLSHDCRLVVTPRSRRRHPIAARRRRRSDHVTWPRPLNRKWPPGQRRRRRWRKRKRCERDIALSITGGRRQETSEVEWWVDMSLYWPGDRTTSWLHRRWPRPAAATLTTPTHVALWQQYNQMSTEICTLLCLLVFKIPSETMA